MRAATLALALFAAAAHAGWRSATVAGTARDVNTPDAGVAVVATSGGPGAVVFASTPVSGPTAGQSLAGNYVTAVLRGPCLMGYATNPVSSLVFDSVCAGNYLFNINGGRLRVSESGMAYAYTWNLVGIPRLDRLDAALTTASPNWATLPTSSATFSAFAPLSTLATDAGDWAATELYPLGVATLTTYKGGVAVGSAQVGFVRDLTLFDRGGRPGAIIATDAGQLILSDDLTDGGFTVIPVPLLNFTSATFSEKGGSAYGRGFGMATAGAQVFSAVPNPGAVGRQWVPRTGGGTPTTLTRVSCLDPTYCAGIAATGAPNVFTYTNDVAPAAEPKPATVTAGTFGAYVLDAGDGDGDPIWVTWIDGGFVWDGGNPTAIAIVGPPATCSGAATAAPLIAVLSDGYAPHDRVVSIPVMVTAGAVGLPALVAAPPALTQTAGSGVTDAVNAAFPPDSGCTTPALAWSFTGVDGGFTIGAGAGGGVTVTPPATFCSATPQTFNLVGSSGSPDASVTVPVTLNPWGAPNAPSFAPPVVTQQAGASVMHAPTASATHDCAATPGFPGTDLLWFGIDAGATPAVTITPGPNALTIASTDACRGGTVFAQARRQVIGVAPAQVSAAAGLLQVNLVPSWTPITAATPFDAGFAYDAAMSKLRGDFSLGVNCASDRDLRAEVVVAGGDGGTIASQRGLPVPGPWAVDVPGGCSGGDFFATASLIDDAGVRYGPQPGYAFTTGRLPAHVPLLTATEVPVTCADGARGVLSLAIDPADCATQQFSWAGSAVVDVADGGARATFATPTRDLQAQAGSTLTFTVTATVGPGNTDTAVRSVRLVPQRFIEVTHRSDVPIAREEESVGVEVTLTNPTACAVSGVVLREALGGLKPVPGTVRVEGVAIDAGVGADMLEVPGLAIPARGATRVQYLARVPLLSAARPFGVVTLAGTDVTVVQGLAPPPAGCGCNSSSAGFALLAIAAALVRSKRRTR